MLPRPITPRVLRRSSVPRKRLPSHLPSAGGNDGLGNLARHGQHQAERVLRHRDGAFAGHVHHQDAGGGGRVEVDKIGSYAGEGDDPQFFRRVDLRRRDFRGARCEQHIGVGQMLRDTRLGLEVTISQPG